MLGKARERSEGVGLVRVLNEQAVLETILQDGPISRPAIARKTGLSLPTVTSLVDELDSIGLISAQGQVFGNVGRPALLYSVNPRAGYVFAVDLGSPKIVAGVTNLFGEVLAETTAPPDGESPDSLVLQLVELHTSLRERAGFGLQTSGAACIAVPGVWDPQSDTVGAAFNLPVLGDMHLQATAQRALGLPVVIENDVNLAAVGESWKGRAQGQSTFVAFYIGTGIGMGIVIGGEVYRGRTGAAGEIGLLPIGADPFHPEQQLMVPFEAAAAGSSISRRIRQAIERREATILEPADTVAEVIAAAAAGDVTASAILDDEARTLALGVAATVSVLDPGLVILGGDVGAHTALADLVHRYTRQLVPWTPAIEVSTLGSRAAFYGAIALGLPAAREQVLIETRANA